MKRITLLACITIFMSLVLGSCSKDSDATPDQKIPDDLSVPYIAMKVDGKWWISEKSKMDKTITFYVSGMKSGNTNDYSINLHASSTNNFEKDFEVFSGRWSIPAMVKVGTYNFPISNNYSYVTQMGYYKPIEGSNTKILEKTAESENKFPGGPFKINITQAKILPNTPNQAFIQGTFEGLLKKKDGTVVKITEGHFKSMYLDN